MADTLGVPRPQGSIFLFIDVSQALGPRGIWGFLICFTSTPPERTAEAARRLAARRLRA